jgi:hypothetical protein
MAFPGSRANIGLRGEHRTFMRARRSAQPEP